MWWILLRTGIIYGVLVGGIRLMGKRQIGQLEPSELVVTMLVADLAASPIQNEITLWEAVLPIGAILLLEMLVSWLSLHSLFWRKLLCGKPVILIENGKLLQENLKATRVTLDELSGYLRQKDVLDISTVQYAILETGGDLSVFPFPEEMPPSAKAAGISPGDQSLPITVICDGRLLTENLKKAGKDKNWLQKELDRRKAKQAETFLLTVDGKNNVVHIRKTLRRRPGK